MSNEPKKTFWDKYIVPFVHFGAITTVALMVMVSVVVWNEWRGLEGLNGSGPLYLIFNSIWLVYLVLCFIDVLRDNRIARASGNVVLLQKTVSNFFALLAMFIIGVVVINLLLKITEPSGHSETAQQKIDCKHDQQTSVAGFEQVNLNVVITALCAYKGDVISFAWKIDCRAANLPTDCNGWPTRITSDGCTFDIHVGETSGQFQVANDQRIIFAKTPQLDTPVSTSCSPNQDDHIAMYGVLQWTRNAKH
jgi:hypothetical protein